MNPEEEDEAVDVIAKLTPEAATSGSSAQRLLQSKTARLGVSLEPLHPSTSDPELATYFIAHVDPAARHDVIEQLLGFDGVEGAYAKRRGEPPEGSF